MRKIANREAARPYCVIPFLLPPPETLAPQGPRKLPKLDVAGSTPVARTHEVGDLSAAPLHAPSRRWQFGDTKFARTPRARDTGLLPRSAGILLAKTLRIRMRLHLRGSRPSRDFRGAAAV